MFTYLFLTLSVLVVVMTIAKGVISLYKGTVSGRREVKKALKINLGALLPVMTGAIVTSIPKVAFAASGDTGSGLGFLAAALSTGLAAIAAGYAVAAVGSSAIGAVSEDSKILGKTLIIVGLAEGIAIYGLIISIMILGRL